MITFETKQLKSRRKVQIDGQDFTVRRMGNIEVLEYSRAVRRLQALAKLEASRELTKKESEEVDTISLKLAELTINLFDDGGDQSKSRALVSSLAEEEISEIMALAFEDKPEEVSNDGTDTTQVSEADA